MGTLYESIFTDKTNWKEPILFTTSNRYSLFDLDQKINYFISELKNSGEIKKKKVAILTSDLSAFTALMIAVNQLGGIVVPLSLQYRKEDLDEILNLIEPQIVFTIDQYNGFPFYEKIQDWAIRSARKTVIYYHSLENDNYQKSIIDGIEAPLVEEEIDLITCTSGSTGVPKGVMLTFDAVKQWTDIDASILNLNKNDRLFSTIPFTVVYGINWLLASLYYRVPLVTTEQFDISKIIKLLLEFPCNKLTTTPSLYKMIYMFSKNSYPRILQNMEVCGLAGERIPDDFLSIFEEMNQTHFANLYGLSEQGVIMFANELRKKHIEWTVCENISYQLIDETEEGVGELSIRSPYPFAGYYNRPDLKKDSYTDDGWYYTGDLVKLNSNQTLEIVGRKKDMIKKAGQQIIPGEIEHSLLKHTHVQQCVVIGIPHPMLGEQIVAFIVPIDQVNEQDLYKFAKENLAGYKVPDKIIQINEIPFVQGKVDKISLRNMM